MVEQIEEEIVLSELNNADLVEQMFDDLYDGLAEEISEATQILLDRNWAPYDILTKALVAGMKIVGDDFRDGRWSSVHVRALRMGTIGVGERRFPRCRWRSCRRLGRLSARFPALR